MFTVYTEKIVDPRELKPFIIKVTVDYHNQHFKERMNNINNKVYYMIIEKSRFLFKTIIKTAIHKKVDLQNEEFSLIDNDKIRQLDFINETLFLCESEQDQINLETKVFNEFNDFLSKEKNIFYDLATHPNSNISNL
ncbi:hypothetical protein BTS2_3325 [Bacillus sp. TS-2]|nr:hypothetical protein BTS2_3325 [Bacillus sp. TS-2]